MNEATFLATPWERVNGCWLSPYNRDKDGYSRIRIPGNKQVKAHRFMWGLTYGPVPDGAFVLHHCDTPACVNPEHLFLGDHTANMADRARKGRGPGDDRNGSRTRPERRPRGEFNKSSKLAWVEVDEIRRRHEYEGASQIQLGRDYGVSATCIMRIIRRLTWA